MGPRTPAHRERRGYQSNSTSEEKKDSENKKVLAGIEKNRKPLEDKTYESVGAMIYELTKDEEPNMRIRRNKDVNSKRAQRYFEQTKATKPKDPKEIVEKYTYRYSVSRGMLRDEVDLLFEQQAGFDNAHSGKAFKERYEECAFTQRPLRFKASMVGLCTFEEGKQRAPKRCYLGEEFVVLSRVLNTDLRDMKTGSSVPVRLIEHCRGDGSMEEACSRVLEVFKKIEKPTYLRLRKELAIPEHFVFASLDYHRNHETAQRIATDSKKFFEKESWLSDEQRSRILDRVSSRNGKTNEMEKTKAGNIKLKTNYRYAWIRNILRLEDSKRFKGVRYDKNPESEPFATTLRGYHELRKALGTVDRALFERLFADRDRFHEIASILTYTKDDKEIRDALAARVFEGMNLDEPIVKAATDALLEVSFSEFLSLSREALEKLLPLMREGLRYHEAATKVYGHHSQQKGEPRARLRPLSTEETNQITNPTVKRAISQFRILVNAIIRTYGPVDAMHIELVRDLKHSKEKRIEIAVGQKRFREEKEHAIARFKENFGREPKGEMLLKFRLYEEQHGKCIYSGEALDIDEITKSGYAEVDHILPYSRSFDNSLNNKVLCLSSKNREKGNQTPFEWIAKSDEKTLVWQEFKERVHALQIKPAKRNKLFNTTLPNRYGNAIHESDSEEKGFLERNLSDTAYAARFIKGFVEKNLLFSEHPDITQKVKVRSGALTDVLRHHWGAGNKDRRNNLHHAEDAVILAFATQSEVQRLSTAAAASVEKKESRRLHFDPPCPDFRDQLRKSVEEVFVSFAPRRKISGAAHKETIKKKKDFSDQGEAKFSVNHGVAEKGVIKRVDVFKSEDGEYRFVPLYPNDFYKKELPDRDVKGQKVDERFQFCFSLFKDELIEIKKRAASNSRLVYFKFIQSDGRIQIQEHFQAQVGYENAGHSFVLSKEASSCVEDVEYIDIYRDSRDRYRFVAGYRSGEGRKKMDMTGQELDEDFKKLYQLVGRMPAGEKLESIRDAETGPKRYVFTLRAAKGDIQLKINDMASSSSVARSGDVLVSTGRKLEYIKKYQVDVLGNYTEVKSEKRLPLVKEMRKIKKERMRPAQDT